MKRICVKCNTDMILDCEVYTRASSHTSVCFGGMESNNIGLGIEKKKGKGVFDETHATVKVALCPECGTIEYYVENPKDFL